MPLEKVLLGDAIERGIKKVPIVNKRVSQPCKRCDYRKRSLNRTGIKVVIYRSK